MNSPRPSGLRPFLRRAVASALSVASWPLEMFGAVLLMHYGSLFSSNTVMGRDYRGVVAQIMPDDTWGIAARLIGAALFGVCLAVWLCEQTLHALRTVLSVGAALIWGVLIYSCARGDVPFAIWRMYVGYFLSQLVVLALLRAQDRQLEEDDDEEELL